MKKIFKTAFPSWLTVAFILLLVIAVSLIQLFYFRKIIYNYEIFLPKNTDGVHSSLKYGSQPALANADFFNSVRDEFINGKANFIEADLSTMKLKVYKNGASIKEVDILSKGKEGSWWETPAGIYKIESKEKNHFSSFGRVYQPWSMIFQGNFFIHGWPYYQNGNPVSSAYSGGCIRLSNTDAEDVFNLTEIGTPVLVFEKDFNKDNFIYQIKTPSISAKNYLAVDLKNNFVFLGKNSNEVVPIASVTKLITGLVAVEYINIEKEIPITEEMIIKTSKPRLKTGSDVSVFNLLHLLLLESSNEAAEALANYLGPKYFINLMNQKAISLGMKNTKFADSFGGSAENVSTAEDLFELVKYIYNNRHFLFDITSGRLNPAVYNLYGEPIFSNLQNFNIFESDKNFIGGKIGKTNAAGETFVSIFELEFNGEKRPIAIIILDSEDVEKDTKIILDYVKNNY